MKLFILVVIFIIVLIVAGLLGAKNEQLVTFDYLFDVIEMRLSLLLAAFFTVGLVLSGLVFLLVWLKLKWRIGKLERQQTHAYKLEN